MLTPVIKPGERFAVGYVVRRSEICPTTAYRIVFDGGKREIAYEPESRPAFGPIIEEMKVIVVPIPKDAIPGPARYRLIMSFECNWWQKLFPKVVIENDLAFTIAGD